MPIKQIFQINTKTINPNVGIGISIPFTSPSAFRTTYSYKDQIKYNLINLLLTNKGERIFNLDFGTDLRKQLFNQLSDDTYEDITEDIRNIITKYIPEIYINNIQITPNLETHTLNFILDYSIKITQESDNISINFE